MAQLGSTYIEEITNELESEVITLRIIKPLVKDLMTRFDVLIVTEKRSVEIINIIFYRRGNKEMEERALQGDRYA